ncbi:ABC transporter permease [Sansalvadorimonas sp. 2012CJ34-2]|uniref:ABC transporter permease n=1 Tax=Parendozoicomonas callyspongiae TaxID=2942213 RepID=A0ABT0PI12_9GAMM|nr:ABC transporter permease [Sansalvadorimonas sp. 2012CJ34-2]MCL6270989.1 ABC transporter permease [Sansalvadorimonas sp. 2012CJ34-2]
MRLTSDAIMVQQKAKGEALKRFFSNHPYLISFAVLAVIATIINPDYLTYTSLSTLLKQSAIKGVIALGMTLVIISGNIDLSVGAIVALVSGLGVVVFNTTESIVVTLLFCSLFGSILGWINGMFITKGRIAAFIVTLATMSAYRSIIVQIGQGGPFNVDMNVLSAITTVVNGRTLGVPHLALIFVFLAVAMHLLMSQTKFGRYVYAVGSNEEAARLTGINVHRVKIITFCIIGALSGISAFLLIGRLTSITAVNAGIFFELDAIAAVAIGGAAMSGGRGRIAGTFLGAIMLQMIEGILIAAAIPPFLNGLVKGIIILLAVLFQNKKSD